MRLIKITGGLINFLLLTSSFPMPFSEMQRKNNEV